MVLFLPHKSYLVFMVLYHFIYCAFPLRRKKRCIKFSDGDDECEGSSLSSSPTRVIGTEMTSTGVIMTNDDNSVFNEAWEPLKTSSSSHEVV